MLLCVVGFVLYSVVVFSCCGFFMGLGEFEVGLMVLWFWLEMLGGSCIDVLVFGIGLVRFCSM